MVRRVDPAALAAALDMNHLDDEEQDNAAPSEASLREAVVKRTPAERSVDTPVGNDPRAKKSWAFDMSYTDGAGRVFAGRFVNKIIPARDIFRVDALRASLCGNTPVEALSPSVYDWAHTTAHMVFSLDPKQRPPWATDLLAIEDSGVTFALWDKVLSHDRYYFRPSEAESAGGEASEE